MITVITLAKSERCWIATFQGSDNMPNGVPLPLPFTTAAPAETVRNELRRRFPHAAFVTKRSAR